MDGKADLHTHTKHSGLSKVLFLEIPDSVSEPRDVVRAAEARRLDVLCVTDHNSIRGGLEARKHAKSVEIVVGEEVQTADGEVLGLFLNENVPSGLTAQETIDVIHGMGGVAVAPHPFSAHCSALGDMALDLDLDGIEVFNAFHRDKYSNELAISKCGGSGKALTGGSDAHAPMMVGDGYTTFEGRTAEELRKAIVNRRTGFGGEYTTIRNIVWMTTLMVLDLQKILGRSLAGAEDSEGTEYSQAIRRMRRSTQLISLGATCVFLLPPTAFVASMIGDRLNTSKSKINWLWHTSR
ncbi:MAG: PHP domain-containing protein [Thermoplasmata archaeon]